MCATGVTKYCREKYARIWSIASSPESAVKRFRMIRRWETWRVNWDRRRSGSYIGGGGGSRREKKTQRGGRWEAIRREWKTKTTIPPTAGCWGAGGAARHASRKKETPWVA